MTRPRLVTRAVPRARLPRFDSPEWWANRPLRYDQHVRDYQEQLESIWAEDWDFVTEDDHRLWDSAPDAYRHAAIAAFQ